MDLRTHYTIERINEVFFDTLSKKALDKITVTEICAQTGINRSTFYRYYRDVYDIIEQKIDQILAEIAAEIRREPMEMETQFNNLFAILKRYETVFVLLKKQNALKDVSGHIFHYFTDLLSEQGSDAKQYFIYYGFVGLFRYWLERDMQLPSAEVAHQALMLYSKIAT